MGRTQRTRQRRRIKDSFRCTNLSSSEDSIALCKFMKQHGWSNEIGLMPGIFAETGRGIYSKKTIKSGELIIELPFEALITLATLEKDNRFQLIFAGSLLSLKNKLSIQTLLAVYLLYLKHSGQHRPYVDSIPESFSNPFFCTKSEMFALPEHIFEKVHKQCTTVKDQYQILQEECSSAYCSCCDRAFFPDTYTQDLFRWAYFAVNTRSVYVDPASVLILTYGTNFNECLYDKPNTALAPFLDLINHSDSVQTTSKLSLRFSEISPTSSVTYQLYGDRSFAPHSQVFINYGSLDNATLLVNYGFSIGNNRHDCVRMVLEDLLDYCKYRSIRVDAKKLGYIRDNTLHAEMFVTRNDGLSHNLLVMLTLLLATIEFSTIASLAQVAFGKQPNLSAVRVNAIDFIEFIHKKLRKHRNDFEQIGCLSEAGNACQLYLRECDQLLNDVAMKVKNTS